MKTYTWHEGMSLEDTKNLAYFERNMLALLLGIEQNQEVMNLNEELYTNIPLPSGYYVHGEWSGWTRVISLHNGRITFHVPDDFDLGDLPEIKPNWDGHTTEEKWKYVMERCGCVGDNYA
jgi:hypothetical protein